jgi:hypothetical protein
MSSPLSVRKVQSALPVRRERLSVGSRVILREMSLCLNEDKSRFPASSSKKKERDIIMSLGLILVVVVIILLLGGFSGRFGGYGYGYGHGGVGVLGTILIVILVLMLLGRI